MYFLTWVLITQSASHGNMQIICIKEKNLLGLKHKISGGAQKFGNQDE